MAMTFEHSHPDADYAMAHTATLREHLAFMHGEEPEDDSQDALEALHLVRHDPEEG